MAFFKGDFSSKILKMQVSLAVILPEVSKEEAKKTKVVYMLHGKGGNYSDWSRYTRIESYASRYNIAVIMPEVHRSYYMNMANGLAFFEYITEELPNVCERFFKLSIKREDSYIMGLSMGGYGALKCAFRKPQNYKGCGAFSPAVKIKRIAKTDSLSVEERRGIFGEDFYVADKEDLFYLIKTTKDTDADLKTELFLTCGRQDELYPDVTELREALLKKGITFEYKEWEGAHEWAFWDESVKCAFEYFFKDIVV